VNGPGESREADVGVTGSSPRNLVFIGGKPHHKVESGSLVDDLEQTIRAALADKAAAREPSPGSLIAKA
jgi:(E)-4-hydroxy-3-methylbut-2-enyl-diphosphate synthase